MPRKIKPRKTSRGKKHAATIRAALADPAVRAKISAASRARWTDPEKRAKMTASCQATAADPDVRARLSASGAAAWADPKKRARLMARHGWLPPPEHEPYYRKMRINGISKDDARQAIEKIQGVEQA